MMPAYVTLALQVRAAQKRGAATFTPETTFSEVPSQRYIVIFTNENPLTG